MSLPLKLAIGLSFCVVATAAGQGTDPYFGNPPVGAPATPVAAPLESEVRYFNRRDITMPVQVYDQATRELRLFVSDDQGRNWRLQGRARPDVPSITFNAPQDGEYWFALHTVTPANAFAEVPLEFVPALKLRIDTQRPVFDAELFAGEGGGVGIRWSIQESFIDFETLTIEYRPKVTSGPVATWNSVPVPPPIDRTEDPARRTVLIWPETSQRLLEFRLSVADRAGNRTVLERELQLPWIPTEVRAIGPQIGVPPQGARTIAAQELQGPRNVPWGTESSATAVIPGDQPGAFSASSPSNRVTSGRSWSSTVPSPGTSFEADAEQPVHDEIHACIVRPGGDRRAIGRPPCRKGCCCVAPEFVLFTRERDGHVEPPRLQQPGNHERVASVVAGACDEQHAAAVCQHIARNHRCGEAGTLHQRWRWILREGALFDGANVGAEADRTQAGQHIVGHGRSVTARWRQSDRAIRSV